MFQELTAALKATGIPFETYAWTTAPSGTYGVVSLDGAGDTVFAGGHCTNQAVQGTVDLFVNGDTVAPAQAVQEALDGFDGCAWRLNSVQFEEDTMLVHWEWIYQLEMM